MSETEKERRDRDLIELLNELRVALPGVQVMFAFLLVVPFSQGYERVTSPQRTVYFASFLCTAAASALFIAPSVYHRIQFRESDKEQMLKISNNLAIAATAFLAAAMTCVVFFITDFLYGSPSAAMATGIAALLFLGLWFALPLSRRLRNKGAGT